MNEGALLGVVHSPRSSPWAQIAEAANGLCRLLWILDSNEPGAGSAARVLGRFGKVVDSAGCTDQELVQLVYAEHPDGIISYYDTNLYRQACLAAALELPSHSVRAAAHFTDKLLQRQVLEAAGVPVPKFSAIREPADDAEIERLSNLLTYPLVLKPRAGTASSHVYLVPDATELHRLLGEVERPMLMLLEECMEDLPTVAAPQGDFVAVDSIVSQGIISHVGVTGYFTLEPPFRLTGGFQPANISSSDTAELFDLATACVATLGSGYGCIRTEIKLTPQGPHVIEVNGRSSGMAPALFQLRSGLSLLTLSMRLALGEHVVLEGPVVSDRVAYRYFRQPPISAERVIGISGLSELGELPGVVQIDVHRGRGELVDWRNGSADRVFQVTGTIDNYAELAEHYRACAEDVLVEYEHRT